MPQQPLKFTIFTKNTPKSNRRPHRFTTTTLQSFLRFLQKLCFSLFLSRIEFLHSTSLHLHSTPSPPSNSNNQAKKKKKLKMLCRSVSRKQKSGKVPVYVNVYDLTSVNGYAYWLGLGAYHSGLQVHGVEYAFGAHDQSSTGVFEVDPKTCPGFTFRKSILVGWTDLDAKQVRLFMEKLSQSYHGNTYNLIAKNCNHFCNDACVRLTGNSIPSWVNRLARLGVLCNCVLPASLNVRRVEKVEEEERKLRSRSRRFGCADETATFRSEKMSCAAASGGGGRKQRRRCSAAMMMVREVEGIKC